MATSETRRDIAKLRRETPTSSVPPVSYQVHADDKTRVYFKEEKSDRTMEFLIHCEKYMEMVSNRLIDSEKINWVARYVHDAVRLWHYIITDNLIGYDHSKAVFRDVRRTYAKTLKRSAGIWKI